MTRLPEGVYKKPAALTELDRELIRRHPEDGARMLRSIEFLPDVFDIILAHHEEPDGTGYPRGLDRGDPARGPRSSACWMRTTRCAPVVRTGRRSGRPWRSRSSGGTPAEQFDSGLVDALVRVLVDRGSLRSGSH